MDQVSRPLQILLAGVLVFAALWFVALRPKDGGGGSTSTAATPAPTTSTPAKSAIPGGLGSAVDKARTAKTAGDAAAATRSSKVDKAAGPGAATTPAPAGARTIAPTPSTSNGSAHTRALPPGRLPSGPARVRSALARGHAVVVLFSSRRGADDRQVRSELRQVHRRGGRVLVMSASLGRVSLFTRVLGGAQILQSPTVVVLRRARAPRLFVGYTDHTELDQAARAALHR